MNLYTQQKKVYPHILLTKTKDLTQMLTPDVKGVVGAVGKLQWGNPHFLRILKDPSERVYSTLVSRGGEPENELSFQISEFFSGYPNGTLAIGRAIRDTSKASIINVIDSSGDLVFDYTTDDVNIIGANNIKDWADTATTKAVEICITACPTNKCSLDVVVEDDMMTLSIYDDVGSRVYKITGGVAVDSVDDLGNSNYIGSLADERVAIVKIDKEHADIKNGDNVKDFSINKTFAAGELVDMQGTYNYDLAIEKLETKIEQIDYVFTGGISDVATITKIRAITKKAGTILYVDIKGNTFADMLVFNTSLNITEADTCKFWATYKDKFKTGNQRIGLSGFVLGQTIARNLSSQYPIAEDRASEGIAGKDYPLPRKRAEEIILFTDEQRTVIAKARINYTGEINEVYCVADVLTANIKNQATKLITVADTDFHIKRVIAKTISKYLFKNMRTAINFTEIELGKFFRDLSSLKTFNNEYGDGYIFKVYDEDFETIAVEYEFIPAGLTRKGAVRGTITDKIQG